MPTPPPAIAIVIALKVTFPPNMDAAPEMTAPDATELVPAEAGISKILATATAIAAIAIAHAILPVALILIVLLARSTFISIVSS